MRVLGAVPGLMLTGEVSPDDGADAVLEFAGSSARVAVQVKSRANAATAWRLVRDAAARPGTRFVLVAGESTADARRILESTEIGVVDGLGNAHIDCRGCWFIWRAPTAAGPARAAGREGRGGGAGAAGASGAQLAGPRVG